ncbi:SOS response-associated peptidase [Aurantiacibacter flavus]|uniref:Abasic site processing protein n=1 Tax=Aurantiacibacter flavus TaxID=3145232 RepID=A0ABV0CY69_9SPHN
MGADAKRLSSRVHSWLRLSTSDLSKTGRFRVVRDFRVTHRHYVDTGALSDTHSGMCNLYRTRSSTAEIAQLFRVEADTGANFAVEVYPGYSGAVILEGQLRSMVWGFPLVLKSKKTGQPLKPKPVNNARTDKLDSFMWRYSFAERRCLIPLTAWAEAQGQKGGMTRTWLSLPDQELFAIAGIWRDSDEWGECYSMVMTDAAGDAAQVHSRMPVILHPSNYAAWQCGSLNEAMALCVSFDGPLAIDRTAEPWVKGR